jgi:hypothetical protein
MRLGGSQGSVNVTSTVVVSDLEGVDPMTVPVIVMIYVPGVMSPDS